MHSEQDLARFFEALRLPTEQNGVGTLAEKRLHAALKRYYAPDSSCLEVPIGRYVADVFDGTRIVEIQTKQFARLVGKLHFFLERYPTTVVYPMPRTRYLVWTDPETGETKPPRKSPVIGKPLDAFHELYHIRDRWGWKRSPSSSFCLTSTNTDCKTATEKTAKKVPRRCNVFRAASLS